MGCCFSCIGERRKLARAEATTTPPPPTPPPVPRLREPYRESATSNMTHSTTLTGASTIAMQGLDGRTRITVFGKSHEDPLRCNPAQPEEEARGRTVRRQAADDDEALTKRIGMVFLTDTEKSSPVSTREGTHAEDIFERVETNDTARTVVQTREPPQGPESAQEHAQDSGSAHQHAENPESEKDHVST
ncbi:hypothetical protein LMH87_002752 [Akanthomyces muscarius]|uniref:Uncharacterized protein n=1 Tax=Akanthomyces muscarius TaxID=2231603 RepID=A0A9W8Q7F8_AKAMU|nr:hypothetical protein LMH87_002752 [Akanthomyces muscarius]KAJ4148273.1 hypothetical protein LMH87_002752 [Akanthomyces muscarius]